MGHVEGRPNDPLYYLKDAIGSVTAITNMNSEIIDSNRFAPYGEALDPVAKNARLTNSPFGYTGETHDIEGGLVYLRARYNEPDTMRFLQQDTVMGDVKEPVTWNSYAYAGNNPVNNIDPFGHWYLNVGSTGNDVKVLQRYLKVAGDYAVSGKETYGYYSDKVKSSVKGWQKGHNKPYTIRNEYGEPELKYRTQISADGLAGTETWKAMGYKMTSSGQPDRNSKEYVGSLNMANQESSKRTTPTPKSKVPDKFKNITLTRGDLIFLYNNEFINEFSIEQKAAILLKLKNNGKLTGDDLVNIGIMKRKDYKGFLGWLQKTFDTANPDSIASLLEALYRLNQYGTSFNELEYEQQQKRQAEVQGLIYFMAANVAMSSGNYSSKVPEPEFKGFNLGNKETANTATETFNFNSPATRHYYSKVTQGSVAKDVNTVIMPEVNVSADVEAINAGQAVRNGNTFTVNGRTYGMHDGTLYPMSGDGLVTLDRGAYKALGVYKKFGNSAQAETILNNMGVSQATRNEALNVYNTAEGIK